MSSVLRGRRILVVEDERAMRETLRARLEGEGALVETADDAAAARLRVPQGAHDLLLLDYRPPDAAGLALLEQLKAAGAAGAAVVISASASTQDVVRAVRAGAADYLPKPFDLHELVRAAERAVLAPARPRPGRLLALPAGGLVLDDLIRDLLDQALEQSAGNKSRAAQLLGIHRDQVRYWVKKHGLARWIRTRGKSPSRPERGRE